MSGSVEGARLSRGPTRGPWPSLARGLVLALAASVGCTDLTGPGRLVSVTPELRAVSFDDLGTSLRDGGVLILYGAPSDATFTLDSHQRVALEVTVSSGDRESAGLYNMFCPRRERLPGHFQCFRLDVAMREGHDAAEIAGHLSAAGGRFIFISAMRWFAAVVFFSPDDPLGRAKRARSWPGVAYTALPFLACVAASCPSLTVPVPVDTGPAVPGDGIVQVSPGDTVSVTYRQPGGGLLQMRLPVQ